ncbi:MAG: twin-arginine translocase TatA/TatE family subunit [Deltaproteobacteria bacterium]|nr:MAG: twin-arginine translocase TatA/TatE family subunit [Deltaproteobacteria bacterium]
MFGLGVTELIIILVIILIMFGAGKLPEIGEGLGRGIRNFRRSVKAPDEIDVTPKDEKEVESDRQGAPPKQS